MSFLKIGFHVWISDSMYSTLLITSYRVEQSNLYKYLLKSFPHSSLHLLRVSLDKSLRFSLWIANGFSKLLQEQVVLVKYFSHSLLFRAITAVLSPFWLFSICFTANGQLNKIAIVCVIINNLHNALFWWEFYSPTAAPLTLTLIVLAKLYGHYLLLGRELNAYISSCNYRLRRPSDNVQI